MVLKWKSYAINQDKYASIQAYGYLCVANEAMCRPIRALTQAKGYALPSHTLACFGSAGGQHACAIARTLGERDLDDCLFVCLFVCFF